jgi:hypothetical protein
MLVRNGTVFQDPQKTRKFACAVQLGCSWIMSFLLNNKKGVDLGSTGIKQVCRWQDNDY